MELRAPFTQVGRAVLESASAAFQAAADQPSVGARVSATDPSKKQQKKPDVLMTPGFRSSQFVQPSVTPSMDNRRTYSPYDRRTVLLISIFV
jgi:hypothetical protein